MSLAEIEKAIDQLPPKELTKLAAHIARRDKLAWDKELEEDFAPGGKHEKALEKIDSEIDSGHFTPLPMSGFAQVSLGPRPNDETPFHPSITVSGEI